MRVINHLLVVNRQHLLAEGQRGRATEPLARLMPLRWVMRGFVFLLKDFGQHTVYATLPSG